MAADPIDILADFPGWPIEFDLYYRQEQSRTASGQTYVKDMGSPLWKASFASRTLKPSELAYWRSRFNLLGNGLFRFYARPTNCYPWAYPNGDGLGDITKVTVQTIGADNSTLTFSGLPSGYKFTIGDKIQLGERDLYDVSNLNGLAVKVSPALWPGVTIGTKVTLIRPHCLMTVTPGTFRATADASTGRGQVSFDAMEAR